MVFDLILGSGEVVQIEAASKGEALREARDTYPDESVDSVVPLEPEDEGDNPDEDDQDEDDQDEDEEEGEDED